LLLGYHWLLRPIEHLGDRAHIRVCDVNFFTLAGNGVRGVGASLVDTKGLQRMHSFSTEQVRSRAMPGSPLCPVQALRDYFDCYQLGSRPQQLLFPAIGAGGSLLSTPMSHDDFNARLRRLLTAAGVPAPYSARSLRSGRRSDLRNAGTPTDVVCQLGRWKSESASFRYQRADNSIIGDVRIMGLFLAT
jgi:hypothetical protein